jgi:hypothetical protein
VSKVEWSEQMVQRLCELHAKGWAYSAIGERLGLSRSAISGKCARLGLKRGMGDGDQRRKEALYQSQVQARSKWTVERDDMLRQFAADGLSMPEAAKRLGLTYGMVKSRVGRLRMSWPRHYGKGEEKPAPDTRPLTVQRRDAAAAFEIAAPADAIPLVGRPFGRCAWPVGTPDTPGEQLCCGRAVQEGSRFQYCPDHMRLSFRQGTGMAQASVAKLAGVGSIRATVRPEKPQPDLWDMAA